MLGRTLRVESGLPQEPAILIGTLADLPQLHLTADLPLDGYWLTTASAGGVTYTVITAANDRGVLYGTFAFLRKIALAEPVAKIDEKQAPYAPVRWVNEWKQPGWHHRARLRRAIHLLGQAAGPRGSDARRRVRPTAASLGINACSINNVNANPRVLAADFIPQVVRIAEAFRPWGVRVALASISAAPKRSADSILRPARAQGGIVVEGPRRCALRCRPDLAGFVLKADSEGRVGPATYGGRTQTPPICWRAPCNRTAAASSTAASSTTIRDWTNPKNDRGRAA
jgi:alpha-glucuronidase